MEAPPSKSFWVRIVSQGVVSVSQREKWARLAERWQDQGPPATPSLEDTENFAVSLRENLEVDKPTIGILGCTPSLRARLRREWPQSRIALVDFCNEMYLATSATLDESVTSQEDYFAVDWLNMESRIARQVDAFIGDKSLDNVDIDDWDNFFRSVAQCLRPGGLLVLHVGFPDPSLAGKSFESLIEPWIGKMAHDEVDLEHAAAGLWEDLLSGSAENSTTHLSLESYRDDLEKHRQSITPVGLLSARVLTDFASQLDARWTRFDQTDVTASAGTSAFGLVQTRYSRDYSAAPNQPVMVFRLLAH